MGNEAENLDIEETIDEEIKEVNDEETSDESEDTQPHLTQEQLDDVVNKRLKRESKKTEEALKNADIANTKLAEAEEKSKLLELAMSKQFSEPEITLPNADDFDGGEFDPEYVKKKDAYLQHQVTQQVDKQVSERLEQADQVARQREEGQKLQLKKVKHNEGLVALGVKDVDQVQKAITGILGEEAVDVVIASADDSPALLNYLSKNEDEAYEIADLINAGNTFNALIKLGKLSARLEVNTSHETAPDPVDNLQGESSTSTTALERKDDAMFKKYEAGKATLQELLTFRKEAKKVQT